MDRTEGPVTPEDGPTMPAGPAGPDDGTVRAVAAGPAEVTEPGRGTEPGATDDAADADLPASTGTVPATGVPTGTAPRAVLRPVPEGFPTPPPRPARPNRAPARAGSPDPAGTDPGRRRSLVAAAGLAAAIVLVLGVGGGVLAYRALTGGPEAAPAADAPTGDAGSGGDAGSTVTIGAVEVRAESVERREQVGNPDAPLLPEGGFVVVTFDVLNSTSAPLLLRDGIELELADGSRVAADLEASRAHRADSEHFTVIPPGDEAHLHAVFDVPPTAEPVVLHLDLSENAEAGTGTLPLPT